MKNTIPTVASVLMALGMSTTITRETRGEYSVTLGQTDADREAIAAAEAKRERKRAKRRALQAPSATPKDVNRG